MVSLSHYVAWQLTCVTFCLDYSSGILSSNGLYIYHLKLEFMSSFSKFNHNFLSQNSALSCVFESLPELFTLM